MDAYEATRVVLSRIQALDPDNAAKIMGFILLQDHADKEMIRLAFGPESLLLSIVLKARKDLGLLPRHRPPPSPPALAVSSPSWAPPGGDLVDEFQLSFLNEQSSPVLGGVKSSELFYGDVAAECRSPSWGSGEGNFHRRSCSVADVCLGLEAGLGWKPCLYFARGYCKNGSSCRFLHGIPDDASAVAEQQQQYHELLLLRAKMAFPFSPTASAVPPSPSSPKCLSFLAQQQGESQRAAAAALMVRPRLETRDFVGMASPSSRQIYLTFPADSTFREEDVSNYFSIYGPVQDVRIPYQQKRMFGFVTFVYPETVKLILAKGNPHFVCDARVLVKPYKEKGKLADKKTIGLDSRDPYDLQQLVSPGATRMMYSSSNSSSAQEALLRRGLLEEQQTSELQQAIELQSRRFMGLQLLDLKPRCLSSHVKPASVSSPTITATQREAPPPEYKNESSAAATVATVTAAAQPAAVKAGGTGEEESGGEARANVDSYFLESSAEHNLPDSPFASPTKSSSFTSSLSSTLEYIPNFNTTNNSNHLLNSSCFFSMPRFSSGRGAVGM